MNRLTINHSKITLHIADPADWRLAQDLAGSVHSPSPGIFEYTASANNLQRIYRTFTGSRRPQVVEGEWLMSKRREELMNYNRCLKEVEQICTQERVPLEPNGKFVPYAHQTKIVEILRRNPYTLVAADCFLPGTEIRSHSGRYEKIEVMKKGMPIETLKGPSYVERVLSRQYSGNTIRLRTKTCTDELEVTENHQFYVLRRVRCVIKSRANTLCSPHCDRKCPVQGDEPHKKYKIRLVKARDLTTDDCLLFRQPTHSSTSSVNKKIQTLTALWLADGWFYKDKGRYAGIAYGMHPDKKKEQLEAVKLCAEVLDYKVYVDATSKRRRNVTTIIVRSDSIADYFLEECGEYSYGKRLPSWFNALTKKEKLRFLKWLLVTDGHVNLLPPGSRYDGRDSQSLKYTTVSKELAQGVRDALLGLGIPCSVMSEKAKKDANGTNHRKAYRLLINRKFMRTLGWEIDAVKTNLRQTEHQEAGETYTLIPITKIERKRYKGRVFNLTSAGHDSYLTDAGISKNCGLGKTGSVARAIELELARGSVSRGKILISAPLSILEASWMDDIKKFTHLNPGLLWFDFGNEDKLGEEQVILDYGTKPADAVSVRTKAKTVYRNPRGRVLEQVTTLDKPDGPWERIKVKVKIAKNSNGEETPFGPLLGRVAVKEDTKLNALKAMLKDPKYDLFIINHDGVKIYQDALKEHQFAWVIVDESTKIKSPKSQVWKAHVDISWKSARRTAMSGTPNPNGFIDLWAQFYFLDRGLTLEGSMKDFLTEYFAPITIGHFGGQDAVKWVLRSEDTKKNLINRVKRAGIFLKQRDCLDLPPRTDMKRYIRLKGDQERAYIKMEEDLVAEFLDDKTNLLIKAEATNTLAKIMKLRQITAGYLPSSDPSVETTIGKFKTNPKLDDLEGFIEELGEEKLVIACQFQEEIKTVLEKFADFGIASIDGTVPVNKRSEYIRDFQTTDKIRIMVLQPAAAAHGITLTKSSHLFFLSLDYNFEYYYQTAKRIERIGQKNDIFVIHSLASLSDGSPTIDHDLVDILGAKGKDRDALFSASSDAPELASAIADRMIQRRKNRV